MGNKLRDVFNSKVAVESFRIIFKNKDDHEYFKEVLRKLEDGEVSEMQKFDMEYEIVHQQKLGDDVYSGEEETVISTMLGPSMTPMEIPVRLDSGERKLRLFRQINKKAVTLSYLDNPIVDFKITIGKSSPYEITFDSRISRERANGVAELFRGFDELYALVSAIMSGEISNEKMRSLASAKEFWKRALCVENKLGVKFDISEMNDSDGIIIDKLFLLLETDIPLSHPQGKFTQSLTKEEWSECKEDISDGRVLRLMWTEERTFHVFNQEVSLDTTRIIPFATVEGVEFSQKDKVVIKYGPGKCGLRMIEQLPENIRDEMDIDAIDKKAVDFFEYCRNHFYSTDEK